MRNAFERNIAANLKRRKVSFEYETMKIPYTISHTYTPDYILGNGVIIEAKGRFYRDTAAKMLMVKKQHPTLDIRFIFYRAHDRIPGRKTTYAEWAEKNGFPWCEGEIPEDWVK